MKRNWYKFRVKYGKQLDNGKTKKVSEEYLVDAESFTETEKRAAKAASKLFETRSFDITAISREPISEIIRNEDDDDNKWYKAVVAFVTENEDTGEKKYSPQNIYVQATDTTDADTRLRDHMSNSMEEWVVKSIAETKVLDVLSYE